MSHQSTPQKIASLLAWQELSPEEQDERAATTLSEMFDAAAFHGAQHYALLHALTVLRIRIEDRKPRIQPAQRPLRAVIGRGTFTVEGRGEFPVDMLRYDQCSFASTADEAEAGQGYVSGHRRRVTLVSSKRAATTGRWESFGWNVVAGSAA